MNVSKDLMDYLNSVQDLYRSGLPVSLLSPEGSSAPTSVVLAWGDASAKVVFVGLDHDWRLNLAGQPFAGANGELLLAIIENGLKLRAQEVLIFASMQTVPMAAPDEHAKLRAKFASALNAKLVLALGQEVFYQTLQRSENFSEVRGKFLKHEGATILPTYSLSEIRKDLALKREFWADLKLFSEKI